MAYIWGRPNATPVALTESGSMSQFLHASIGTPPAYASERPWPLWAPHDNNYQWMWMDPVYSEYREASHPLMGTWPPPQPGAPYDAWVAEQRLWMPYSQIASNGVSADTSCSDVLGIPSPTSRGQIYHFDFSSSSDWPFVTAWTGVRLVAQICKHGHVTNEGLCGENGPAGVSFWVQKAAAAYPAIPALWATDNQLIQSFELNNYGLGKYVTPYGMNVGDFEFETTTAPSGAWTIADVDKYWFHITQNNPSAQGKPNGSDNIMIGVRKVWAAAIVTLGGSPSGSSPNTGHFSVVG